MGNVGAQAVQCACLAAAGPAVREEAGVAAVGRGLDNCGDGVEDLLLAHFWA